MVVKRFQVYSVKITANTFVSQKNESVHFYSCPQEKLSSRFLLLSSMLTGIVNPPTPIYIVYFYNFLYNLHYISKHRFSIQTTLLKNVSRYFPSLKEYRKLKLTIQRKMTEQITIETGQSNQNKY